MVNIEYEEVENCKETALHFADMRWNDQTERYECDHCKKQYTLDVIITWIETTILRLKEKLRQHPEMQKLYADLVQIYENIITSLPPGEI